jgi:putative transcriptional regulator
MAESLRGQCLIAAKHLADPNFFKTVVLLVEHGPHGAMGLVINRPSSLLVCHALSKHFELGELSDLVYVGGPVEPVALMLLHNVADLGRDELMIVPQVYIGNSEQSFEEVFRQACESTPELRFRVFMGCAGWAPGQLEGELDRGDWHLVPGTHDLVFHEDPYAIYELTLQKVREQLPFAPPADANPQWN